MRIDSHQHFWRYTKAEFEWIDEAMAVLRRDFLPADLRPLLDAAGIDGCIAVQTRQSAAETRFLLGLAKKAPWIRGVVGWVDLRAADVERQLDEFADEQRLVGMRHIAQAESADFLLGTEFGRGIQALTARGLCYDLLVLPPQLQAATQLVARHPEQRFVLDHCSKPNLRSGDLAAWRADFVALAKTPNVACKVSGLVTEADWQHWTPASLRPVLTAALEAFGAERLLFGSDWPVCLCAASYGRWRDTVDTWLAELSPTESAAILGGNAAQWYRLPT